MSELPVQPTALSFVHVRVSDLFIAVRKRFCLKATTNAKATEISRPSSLIVFYSLNWFVSTLTTLTTIASD